MSLDDATFTRGRLTTWSEMDSRELPFAKHVLQATRFGPGPLTASGTGFRGFREWYLHLSCLKTDLVQISQTGRLQHTFHSKWLTAINLRYTFTKPCRIVRSRRVRTKTCLDIQIGLLSVENNNFKIQKW